MFLYSLYGLKIRDFFIVLFLLFQVQMVFCVTNESFVSEKYETEQTNKLTETFLNKYVTSKEESEMSIAGAIALFVIIGIPWFIFIRVYGFRTRENYSKHKTWTIPDVVIIFFSLLIFQVVIGGFCFALTDGFDKQIQFYAILGASGVAGILTVLVAAYFSKLRNWIATAQFYFNRIKIIKILKWTVLIFIVTFLFNIFYNLVLHFFGVVIPPDRIQEIMPETFTTGLILWTLLISSIIVPITEEIVFRGILYRAFRQKWSVGLSIIISSVIFGLVHMDFYRFIPLVVIGAAAAYSLEKTKSIYTPILFHAVNNAVSISLLLIFKKFGYI